MQVRIACGRLLMLTVVLVSATVDTAAQQNTPGSAAVSTAPANEARFPVAHVHFGGVCRGYLYVSAERLRYEVVQPEKDKNHAFQLLRSDVTGVQPWVLAGRQQNIAEIRTTHSLYHFWLLQKDADVNATGLFNGGAAAPAAALIAAIRNPGIAQSQASAQPLSDAATTASQGDSPALPAGALQGIYVALGVESASARFRRLNFNADGWVVRDIPQEGMIGFDFTAYRNDRNTNRNWVGRYQMDGNKINIDWQDFRGPAYPPTREVVKRDEVSAHPAWEVGWDTFIPMCRCTGKRLSGKYNWGAAAAGQYLQFFPDGTFIDHSVTDQLIVPSRFYEHPRVQHGTYSIESQTLIFSFDDGHRGTRTFMAPKVQENDPKFDWIGLGWQTLYEENYEMRLRR